MLALAGNILLVFCAAPEPPDEVGEARFYDISQVPKQAIFMSVR
jgi:hypothetical protein